MKNINRRAFLQIGVAVAATLTGCGGGVTQSTFLEPQSGGQAVPAATVTPPTESTPLVTLFPGEPDVADLTAPNELPPTEIPNPARFFGPDPVFQGKTVGRKSGVDTFDHVVVLMVENRSFDSIVGYLYPNGTSPGGQPFNGVGDKSLSNPIPPYAMDADRQIVPVTRATSLQTPLVDPAEQYGSVNVSLFNEFNPLSNRFVTDEKDYAAPYNLPDGGAFFPPPMSGYVRAFILALAAAGKPNPSFDQYATIMQCFPPSVVPAFNKLAQNFAICDSWHTGVPSQTFCNRSFFHAASSSGRLINSPTLAWTGFPLAYDGNTAPTIFDRLSAAGRTWTIYYDGTDIISGTLVIHYPTLSNYPFDSPYFKTMTDFWDDVENGTLPDYAFVEPRFFLFQNDYHPYGGASAVKRGEILLNDVHQAIRQSNSPTGSNFQNTLLLVTCDEGGTCYDHVPPPAGVPPGDGYTPQFGFGFDRLGQRIPAIVVSAYIEAGTVINTPLNSTSLIKTLEEKWSLPPLNARDAASTSLAGVFNRTTPRTRDEWPRLRLRKLLLSESGTNAAEPLGEFQRALVQAVHGLTTGQDGLPPGVQSVGDGVAYLAVQKAQGKI